jgi:sRNA-binding regulator protein Hfq
MDTLSVVPLHKECTYYYWHGAQLEVSVWSFEHYEIVLETEKRIRVKIEIMLHSVYYIMLHSVYYVHYATFCVLCPLVTKSDVAISSELLLTEINKYIWWVMLEGT